MMSWMTSRSCLVTIFKSTYEKQILKTLFENYFLYFVK